MVNSSGKLSRHFYNALGWVLVGIGIVGYILPVMPGTIFLILALACFKRGNIKFEHWLLNHRIFGPTLRNWEATGSVSRRTKWVANIMMWLCVLASLAAVHTVFARAGIILFAAVGSWYILSRPTTEDLKFAAVEPAVLPSNEFAEPLGSDVGQ